MSGDAGATDIVNCSLCAAGTFLTGSGLYFDTLMTSMPSQHEPGHVLALAVLRSSSMEAASDAESHVLFWIGAWAQVMMVYILMLYLHAHILYLYI